MLRNILYFSPLMAFIWWAWGAGGSLWERSCPDDCFCTVEPWELILLDAQTVRCENRSLTSVPLNLSSASEVLVLRDNNLGSVQNLSLEDLKRLPQLRLLDLSRNHLRLLHAPSEDIPQLRVLDLSHNNFHTLPVGALRRLPNLEVLILHGNSIGDAPMAPRLVLPRLETLDLRRNRIVTFRPELLHSLPRLRSLRLAHNQMTRVPDGAFATQTELTLLDFSDNKIWRLEESSFTGLQHLGTIDLSGNSFRKIPSRPLQRVHAIDALVLDRNPIKFLSQGSISSLNISEISLQGLEELVSVERESFQKLPHLARLALSHNPKLEYVSPHMFLEVPSLQVLDLSHNHLMAIDHRLLASLEPQVTLILRGNPLRCDCNFYSLKHEFPALDADNETVCEGMVEATTEKIDLITEEDAFLDLNATWLPTMMTVSSTDCPPIILPLFPLSIRKPLAANVSYACRANGQPPPLVEWQLPRNIRLQNGQCHEHACVQDDTLTVRYLHVSDSGDYSCIATNSEGSAERPLHIEVESLNVHMVALTIAPTFVTVAWNASSALPASVLLEYGPGEGSVPPADDWRTVSVTMKVQSYTLNGLEPSCTYTVWLCLAREGYSIRLSSLVVTTREEGFLVVLGIRRNYVGIAVVGVGLSLVILSCLALCGLQLRRWRMTHHTELVMSDSISTHAFVKSESAHSDMAFMTYLNVGDESLLVDNDDDESFQ